MLSVNEYLRDPCGLASIPYWKYKSITVPCNMSIVHDKDFSKESYTNYNDEQFFRLYHDMKNINPIISEEIDIVKCEPHMIYEFVKLINESYIDLTVTLSQIESYCKTPVYCPELWIFLKDKKSNIIIGGGIGDYDKEVGEMILEWVQVLPEYRRRGYGQIIVNHMLRQMKGIAHFATVSGKVNNPNNPEKLYRKCGFKGNDVWHILTKAE